MTRFAKPRHLRRSHPAEIAMAALVAAGSAMAVLAGPSSADVTALTGSSFGYFAQARFFGGPQHTRPCANPPTNDTDCRPRPSVTLPAGGSATPITASVDSGNATIGPAVLFTSGPITVSTEGTTGATGSVETTADIQTVNTSEQEVFTADRVTSTCTATESGTSGSTTITNGTLMTSEGNPDVEGDETVVPVPTNPDPNTSYNGTIETVGDNFRYVFNEQIVNPDGSLTINAGHQYLLGPTAVGDVIFGQVVCGVTATASTTTSSPSSSSTSSSSTSSTTTSSSTSSTTTSSSTSTTSTTSTTTSTTIASTTTTAARATTAVASPGGTGGATTSVQGTAGSRVASAVAAGAAGRNGGSLPRTGAKVVSTTLLGVVLLALGAALKRGSKPKIRPGD